MYAFNVLVSHYQKYTTIQRDIIQLAVLDEGVLTDSMVSQCYVLNNECEV